MDVCNRCLAGCRSQLFNAAAVSQLRGDVEVVRVVYCARARAPDPTDNAESSAWSEEVVGAVAPRGHARFR